MKEKIYFILVIVCLAGCQSKAELTVLKKGIEVKMTEWNMANEVTLAEEKKISAGNITKQLVVNVFLKKGKDEYTNSFFYDKKSLVVITGMLNESLYDQLKDYKEILYVFSFENPITLPNTEPLYVEDFNIHMTNESLLDSHQKILKTPTYYDFTDYTLKNIQGRGVGKLNGWIRFLNDDATQIDFDGDFWDLLLEYSAICDHPEKFSGSSVYNFVTVLNAACDPENEGAILPEKLYFYLESCNLDINPEWIKLPFMEMLKKFNAHFIPNEE